MGRIVRDRSISAYSTEEMGGRKTIIKLEIKFNAQIRMLAASC